MKHVEKFILLRKVKFSESDLVIHAISQRGEKMAFLARGALKSKKRFGGGILELMNFVELDYSPSKNNQGLSTLNEAMLIRDFPHLKKDYDKIEFALDILDMISKVVQEGDSHSQRLFQIVGYLFHQLDQSQVPMAACKNLKMQFYLKFLMQQGVLATEPWMAIYLKSKFEDHLNLKPTEDFDQTLQQLQHQLKGYLATATTAY